MSNNKNPNEKQPGEKEPGKFHYNPGNMSGKKAEAGKDKSAEQANVDRDRSRREKQDQRADGSQKK